LPWLATAASFALAVALGAYASQLRGRVQTLERELRDAILQVQAGERLTAQARLVATDAQRQLSVLAAPDVAHVDLKGQAVAPGFVNMLAHPEESLFADGRALSDLTQGVTLEVMGEFSMGPLTPQMKSLGEKRHVPGLNELIVGEIGAQAANDVEMPVARGDTAFLKIGPARIIFDRGPDFFGRKRDAGGEALYRTGNVDADDDPADVGDDGADFFGRHVQLLVEVAAAGRLRERSRPMIAGSMERITTTSIT